MTPTRRAAIAGAGVLIAGAAPWRPRVVSLNPCLDAIVVRVADRGQIAALSHYARDPSQSGIADIARTLPFTYETAEEIVALRPDLVLASAHSSPATRAALARLGIRQEVFGVSDTVADSLGQVRRIAALVGHADRGQALVAAITAALARAAPPPGFTPVTALVFEPEGLVAGEGTLIDDMLRRAGFINAAKRYGLGKWDNVAMEKLLADPPRVLLSARVGTGGETWAERFVRRPALAGLGGRMIQADFPQRLLYCGGPTLIDTAAALAAARDKVAERRA